MFLISSHGEGWEAAFEGFQGSILAPWGAALHASSLCSRWLCQREPLRVRAVHPADGEGLSCHGGLLEGRAPTLGAAELAVLAADGPRGKLQNLGHQKASFTKERRLGFCAGASGDAGCSSSCSGFGAAGGWEQLSCWDGLAADAKGNKRPPPEVLLSLEAPGWRCQPKG